MLASLFALGGQLGELLAVEVGEPETMGGVDDQVEYRPAQTQATRFTRKAADHLRPTAHFFERSLQQVR